MSLADTLHGGFVAPRRARVLAQRIAPHVPNGAAMLDLGCGDGIVAADVARRRHAESVRGADVLARLQPLVPVDVFDGRTLPYPDRSFDAVLLVDVVHHSEDPFALLSEAARVCRGVIIVKDHLSDPWLAETRLRLMDFVGNARHGVALVYRYWDRARWRSAFDELRWTQESWDEGLGLYPPPLRWLFEDSLHFLARLRPPR